MTRRAFNSSMAPRPDGPWSSGVAAGHFLLVSAQLPLTAGGSLVEGDAGEQARRCLDNVAHQLRSQGLGLESVAELVVYLVEPGDAAAVDAVLAERFDGPAPARTLVGVAWVPHGARLQVAALAVRY
jgi:2-iminobutanoate/2-iminopropanoate deaminase